MARPSPRSSRRSRRPSGALLALSVVVGACTTVSAAPGSRRVGAIDANFAQARRIRPPVGASPLDPGPKAIGTVTGARVAPGQSIQAALSANPAGSTIVIGAGVHRDQFDLRPKNNQHIIGEAGAVLDGARVLSGFIASGATWSVPGQPTVAPSYQSIPCLPGYVLCGFNDDLFVDGAPLRRVAAATAVGAGQWFYDYAGGTIVIGTNPSGHLVEISVAGRHALLADQGVGGNGVEVRNLVVEKYGVPPQDCALMLEDAGGGWPHTADPANGTSGGWLVRDNDLRLNHGCGVFAGPGTLVTANKIHDNGQIGLKAAGRHVNIIGNDIGGNNFAGHSTSWEAGGTKFWNAEQLTFSNNVVHDNIGSGAWADYAWHDIVYDHNSFINNRNAGIAQEMTMSGSATNNLFTGNDWANVGNPGYTAGAIFVFNGANFEVAGNTMIDNNGGVIVLTQERGCIGDGVPQGHGACPVGSFHGSVNGVWVHDNDIQMAKGFSGLEVLAQADYPPYAKMTPAWASANFNGQTVRFESNRYRGPGFEQKRGTNGQQFDDASARFVWGFPSGYTSDPNVIWSWTDRRFLGFADWQALAHQDASSVLTPA